MQFISLGMGYLLAKPVLASTGLLFLFALIGTAFLSGGAATLNHILEWKLDAKMDRTKSRPIPSGNVSIGSALIFAVILLALGTVFLLLVNAITMFLGVLTAFLYVAVYTPLKQWSWLNTYVGALPGAIPPLAGWTIATGKLEWQPFIFVALLAIWQLPHFFSIAWMYQDDYNKAGFEMLPKVDPDGKRTVFHILFFTRILIGVSLLPVFFGILGWIYGIGAFVFGLFFLKMGWNFSKTISRADAKNVLKASVYYLPALLLIMFLDRLIL